METAEGGTDRIVTRSVASQISNREDNIIKSGNITTNPDFQTTIIATKSSTAEIPRISTPSNGTSKVNIGTHMFDSTLPTELSGIFASHRDTSNLNESNSNMSSNKSCSTGNSAITQTEGLNLTRDFENLTRDYENILCSSFRDLALRKCSNLGSGEVGFCPPPSSQPFLINTLERSPDAPPVSFLNNASCANKLDRLLAYNDRSQGEVSYLMNKICLLETRLDSEIRKLTTGINDLNDKISKEISNLNDQMNDKISKEISSLNDQFNGAIGILDAKLEARMDLVLSEKFREVDVHFEETSEYIEQLVSDKVNEKITQLDENIAPRLIIVGREIDSKIESCEKRFCQTVKTEVISCLQDL